MAIQISGTTVIDNSRNISANSVTATTNLDLPDGTSAQRPGSPGTGSLRWNSDFNTLEVYNGTAWGQLLTGDIVTDPANVRGLFARGKNPGPGLSPSEIVYVNIATTGNSLSFGSLTELYKQGVASCASRTRGIFGGGYNNPSPGFITFNTIDYVTVATTGNATDFGDLTVARWRAGACSSTTRGVFAGGRSNPTSSVNVIDYITIASTGNATDFGDLSTNNPDGFIQGSCSSGTRGIFGTSLSSPLPQYRNLDYITIASTGNSTVFGNLTVDRDSGSSLSSSTRGIFGGGLTPTRVNTIDYVTIASTGNATDFGDLTSARAYQGSCSSSIRGLFAGGEISTGPFFSSEYTNSIDYVTIASLGNAIDFGDLSFKTIYVAGCSNGDGGLLVFG